MIADPRTPDADTASPATDPQPCDLLIAGARVLNLANEAGVDDNAAIAIHAGFIVAIGDEADIRKAWRPVRRIDATGHVVAPGFVDAHVHLTAFLGAGRPYQKALAPGPFSGAGKAEQILPMIAKLVNMPVSAELTHAVLRPVLVSMLRSGITGVVDAGSSGIDGLVQAASDVGIRAAIGPSLTDLWHDPSGRLIRQADADQLLANASELITRHDGAGQGRIRALVSAVETMACSDELLAGIATLAKNRDVPTHVHTHISESSVKAHLDAFHRTQTQRLHDAGMLSPRCTVMHAGWLNDDDITAFYSAGVTVNHNPVGNAMLGFGTVRAGSVPRLLAAGVPIVLGSDFAPSAISTPFETIRATLLLHRDLLAADNALTLEQALTMATNGSTPLGRAGQLGAIAVGLRADLILVDITGPHHLGVDHPVPALALHGRAADVTTVIVDGKLVVEQRQLVGIDEHELAAAAHRALAAVARHG